MTPVLYMKVLCLQYQRSCDFHVISTTYMRLAGHVDGLRPEALSIDLELRDLYMQLGAPR